MAINRLGSHTGNKKDKTNNYYGEKRFGYSGAFIWNKLLEDLHECKSINLFFKTACKESRVQ